MIDTIILLVGFVAVGLISSLCAIEYGYYFKKTAFTVGLKQLYSLTPNVHSFVLSAVCICTFVVLIVSAKLNMSFDVEMQAAVSDVPVDSALILQP